MANLSVVLQPRAVVLADGEAAAGAVVAVDDRGRIVELADDIVTLTTHHGRRTVDEACARAPDLADATLFPGFVDLQVNGAAGLGCETANATELDAIARSVASGGAAAFLPTLVTAPFERLLERVANLAAWSERRGAQPEAGSARPLGIHLEGPFLGVAGAHDAAALVDPTRERVEALLEAADGALRLVTIAPERAGAADATRRFVDAGVAVALGHTDADAAAWNACVDAGARFVTHLFHAMTPLHHRDLGAVGRALDDERLMVSLIADGVHSNPAALRIAYRVLGSERTVLVSDATAASGAADGRYRLADREIVRAGDRVSDADGRLAGSALTLGRAADVFCEHVLERVSEPAGGRGLPHARDAALARILAANPARAIGRSAEFAPGRPAEFTVRRTTTAGDSRWSVLRCDGE